MPFKTKRDNIWRKLTGKPDEFSMEHRSFNSINIVTLLLLFAFLLANLLVGLYEVVLICVLLIAIECVIYYLARFARRFQLSVMIYAVFSYLALIANFFLNSGINGPTIFIFFLSFSFLIAITRKSQHAIWVILHILVAISLLVCEYLRPEWIQQSYNDEHARYIDTIFTYIITLSFIYYITNYLRNHYEYEKRLATKRAFAVEQQTKLLEQSEAKLRAFFKSSASCHVLLGRDKEILDFNNAAVLFVRQRFNTDIQLGDSITDYVNMGYLKKFNENCDMALSGTRVFEERLLQYDDKESIWWQLSFEPAWDNYGNIIGLSYNATNINERRLQEERIRDKNDALMKIAHIQSHEMRGPVTSIMGLMNIIKDEGYNVPKEYITYMEQAVQELDRKIHEIVRQTQKLS